MLPTYLPSYSSDDAPSHLHSISLHVQAPEVVQQTIFDPMAADIWSLGACYYAMLTACPLYAHPTDLSFRIMARGDVNKVINTYESYGIRRISQQAKHLLCCMLHADPAKRPTLEALVCHPFLNSIGMDA